MPYGLEKETLEKIIGIFAQYGAVQEAIIYGSRAKGNHKPGSDIDLTLKGDDLNLKILNQISLDLDELLLPYTQQNAHEKKGAVRPARARGLHDRGCGRRACRGRACRHYGL
ncbi:MAG: nucleotidyltransferase domain-containing protein [Desulfosarcina sp.]